MRDILASGIQKQALIGKNSDIQDCVGWSKYLLHPSLLHEQSRRIHGGPHPLCLMVRLHTLLVLCTSST
jgi:hypothetical protein